MARSPSIGTTSQLDATQASALDRLVQVTGGARWYVEQSAYLQTPTFAAPPRGRGPRVLAPDFATMTTTKPGAVSLSREMIAWKTIDFLADHKALFKMVNPRGELIASDVTIDEGALGMTHVRLSQVERGVPVVGGELYAHYDRGGRLTSIQGHYVPDLAALAVRPALTAEAVRAIAAAAMGEGGRAERPRLVIFAPAIDGGTNVMGAAPSPPVLGWELVARSADNTKMYTLTIDAVTGEVIDRLNANQSIKGSGVGVKGQTRTLEISAGANGGFTLVDGTRPAPIRTFDLQNFTDLSKAVLVTSSSPNDWDRTNKVGAGSAVDAHVNVGVVYDYFKKTFNRKGWDDKDTQIHNGVHDGALPDNASFNNIDVVMIYGDGKDFFDPLAGALDIIAHEFAHGFTFFTSTLRYENQSGALNESISDVFGVLVEHEVKPDPVNNWLIGEGFVKGDKSLRDIANPGSAKLTAQPSHMKEFVNTQQDQGGVHINSGIPSMASMLMTIGGKHPLSNVEVPKPGIGFDKLAQLWYRANQRYLIASADFGMAAKATLEAAADLKFTQAEVNTIDCAWKAVGVIQGGCAVTPQNTPDGAGADGDEDKDGNGGAGRGGGADDKKKNAEPEGADPSEKKKTTTTTTTTTQSGGVGCSSAPSAAPPGASLAMFGALAGLAAMIRTRTSRRRRAKT